MNYELSIPFALRKTLQRGTVLILCMLFLFGGCNGHKEAQKIDKETFFVNVEDLPEWLQNEIKIIDKTISFNYFRVYQCECENRTIYFLDNPYNSCSLCDFRYENGEIVIDPVENLHLDEEVINFPDILYSAGFTLIYEWIGSSFQDT